MSDKFKGGDVIVIHQPPTKPTWSHAWREDLRGIMVKIDENSAGFYNIGSERSLPGNPGCINWTKESLRVATPAETDAYYKGVRNIKDIKQPEIHNLYDIY